MNDLVKAAKAVIERWETGDLASAVRNLANALPDETNEQLRMVMVEKAREENESDEVEIDDDAQISIPDEPKLGVWVQTWLWARYPILQCSGCEEELNEEEDVTSSPSYLIVENASRRIARSAISVEFKTCKDIPSTK